MVGLPPYTPDQLIDVVVEDDRVWLHLGDFFASPLRLTPDQALALVGAGSTLAATPGAEADGPLGRGLAKLAALARPRRRRPGGHPPRATRRQECWSILRAAAAARQRVEIDYYSYGRDELTTRQIDPYRVVADQGQWYVSAWCHRADGERLFRVDRIRDVRTTEETFERPAIGPGPGLRLRPGRGPGAAPPRPRGALGRRPVPDDRRCSEQPDGDVEVTLPVSALPWLERLLLRLGPDAEVLDLDGVADVGDDVRRAAARRVLARYADGLAVGAPPVPCDGDRLSFER